MAFFIGGKLLKYKGIIVTPAIAHFFQGRIWTREQQIFPQKTIEQYIANGYFRTFAAVERTKNGFRCNRCETTNRTHFHSYSCAKCEQICTYCRHCIAMGRMATCTELMEWCGPTYRPKVQVTWQLPGELTALQQRAADELQQSILQQRDHVLVAVCGAGKTEVMFQPIAAALKKQLRVCVATPRTDVVLELLPRFQQAFPTVNIQALYGGVTIEPMYAPLVIATTHQLYRFQQEFDVIIVDEADAFPYTFDETLQRAVIKAKKEDAALAMVTATPSQNLKQRIAKKTIHSSFIPKRYHNHPLPVPRFEALFRYDKQLKHGIIPKKLLLWTKERLKQQQPFLLFFPTIELMESAIPLFKELDAAIEAVHAQDNEREEKVLRLREEKLKGLLTTTILERGITIKNVQVAVVGAESPIFTASALIQISGRVGRNNAFPTGDICFFHHGITVEMDEAKKEIEQLNRMAFGGGK